MSLPSLIGVIHLAPLPGSPRFGGDLGAVVGRAARDAALLQGAGFDAVIVENFGDAPFEPGRVEPVVVAAMTRCALAVSDAARGSASASTCCATTPKRRSPWRWPVRPI